jgi:hypothetical protein
MVSLPLNSYSKAFTDLFATYNATHSSWNDSVANPATPRKSNFNKFILSNCIFVIKKFFLPLVEAACASGVVEMMEFLSHASACPPPKKPRLE